MTFQSAAIPGDLWRALAVSLALHGLLLWPAPSPREAAGAADRPLTATLRAADAPAIAPADIPAGPRRARPPATPSSIPEVVDRSGVPEVAAAPLKSESAAAPAGTFAPIAAAMPSVSVGTGPDAEGLRSYRLSLAVQARRFKQRYPAGALEAGWSGTAEVRVTVDADAAVHGVELIRHSGHGVLDEAALELLRQAAPATPVPASLRGHAFAVNLPVVFELPE
ncbi:MAG: energy transducer TonB [Candidatus Nitricoxidivorans perseverans]|uniref:Energy transducer TonB n=1 Tax=Candidatus Nitricoxidivorans perseverans TaxID=2975601 RepID=A0AA49J1I3_9PROT|nr:MAG: energy transducer TonB [Candidatus Nitricoxidivorans perseverans]